MVRPFSRKEKKKVHLNTEDDELEEVIDTIKKTDEEPVDMMGQPNEGSKSESTKKKIPVFKSSLKDN